MFTLFPRLPAELQLKIWDATYPRPGIHIFDIRIQPRHTFPRADKASSSETTYDAYTDRVFLDGLTIKSGHGHGAFATQFRSDPSMYKTARILSSTSVDSAKVPRISQNGQTLGKHNILQLPTIGKSVSYDNSTDVLCLRFGSSHHTMQSEANSSLVHDSQVVQSNISRILEAEWCEGMASALFTARRLAIDIGELWSPLGLDPMSVAYLCCCIQNDLEVLYLVDYCIGRCQKCWKGKLKQKELVTTKCSLAKELDPEDREMDVFYGSTVTYREISDLKKLGWDSDHSIFTLAQMVGDTIQEQQGPEGPFRSVRVLACEEAASNTGDQTVCAMCMEDRS